MRSGTAGKQRQDQKATLLQSAYRCLVARRAYRALKEEDKQKHILQEQIQMQQIQQMQMQQVQRKEHHQKRDHKEDRMKEPMPRKKQEIAKKRPEVSRKKAREPIPRSQLARKEDVGGELGRIYRGTPREKLMPLAGGYQTPRARRFVPTAATAAAAQTAEELGGFSFIRASVLQAYGVEQALPDMRRPQVGMTPRPLPSA